MNPERWKQIDRVLQQALELDLSERAAFLDSACASDADLRKEVESLIGSHNEASTFIETPVYGKAAELIAGEQSDSILSETIGQYRIISRLGAGGMAEVYLAEDTRLGRKVAIKFLAPELAADEQAKKRFLREARAAAALDHPNICTIHEIKEEADRSLIVMQYVEGETLASALESRKLGLSDAIRVAEQIADALAEAHSRGIIHRDIKPQNIMLTGRGQAKVLDFGLAKQLEGQGNDVDTESFITKSGMILGTVPYMSPEQLHGEKLDARSDIFSFGAVLYEMVCGIRPFDSSSRAGIISQILMQEPPPLTRYAPDAPVELQRIVGKALCKDKENRYRTTGELLDDLRDLKRELDLKGGRRGSSAAGSGEKTVRMDRQEATVVITDAAKGKENHLTAPATSSVEIIISEIKRHRRAAMAALVILLVAIAGVGFALYKLLSRDEPTAPFQKMELARLTDIGKATDAAISPDGKYVVYVQEVEGKQSLWLKQVSASSYIEIVPPAEGVSYRGPTVSSDGSYIYYLRNEKNNPRAALYRMSLFGGDSKKLIEGIGSEDTRSNYSLSPDGRRVAFIRLDSAFNRSLVVMNLDGTGERVIASRKLPEYVAGAAWSPDGKVVVTFESDFSGGGIGGLKKVIRVSADGGKSEPVSQQEWAVVGGLGWLPDGSGLVLSAAEKPGSLQLWYLSYPDGETRRITNDLSSYESVSLTADSSSLVAVQENQTSNLWLASIGDAGGAQQITAGVAGTDGMLGVSWTPDGKIVYQSLASGNSDIWIVNSDGKGRKRLTDYEGPDLFPAVSPDGRYIAFNSDRAGSGIWRMDIDGGNPAQLMAGIKPCFTSDGKWIVCYLSGLMKAPIEGGNPVSIPHNNLATAPAVSPDGRLIACNYLIEEPNARFRIGIFPFEGGEPVKVFDVVGYAIRDIRWRPDSQAVAYVVTSNGVSNIWSQPIDGGPPAQLTDFKSDLIFGFDWARDGRIAMGRGAYTSDVVMVKNFR